MTNIPTPDYKYTAEKRYQPERQVEAADGRIYYPYLPSDELKRAVELAILLERPLLLEGEPGCGKTRLAAAVAYEFTKRNLQRKKDAQGQPGWWPFYTWNVKSTTRARDGLYTFDAVARLRDAQLMGTDPQRLQEYLGAEDYLQLQQRLKERKSYREFGPLGKALQQDYDPKEAWKQGLRPILLIDEIDKADSDFGNDLLLELEEFRFEIPETREQITFSQDKPKPIIFITSNREKPLPEPLLRRCIYFFVEFPKREKLEEIIKWRFGPQKQDKKKLVELAVDRYYKIRKLLDEPPRSRPPGTSEFIDFLSVLLQYPYPSGESAEQDLENLSERIPLLGTLLKNQKDQKRFQSSQPQP